MSDYPLAQTVSHKPYAVGGKDAHGNAVSRYGDPIERQVYGYGPPARSTEAEPGGTRVIEGLDVYGPTFAVDARDRFVIAGVEYEVEGEPGVWDNGPFGFKPGQVIHLKRVRGGR
ncbi:MAG TPA: hypothetical protein VIQ11_12960 [Mycobacterium sp.]